MLQSLLYVASSLTASPDASIDPSTTSFVKISVATTITGIICSLQRGKAVPEEEIEERASNRGLSAGAIMLGEILFNSSISEGGMDSYTGAVVDMIIPILLISISTLIYRPKKCLLTATLAIFAGMIFLRLQPTTSSRLEGIAMRAVATACRSIGLLLMLRDARSTKGVAQAMFNSYSLAVIPALVIMLAFTREDQFSSVSGLKSSLYYALASTTSDVFLGFIAITSNSLIYAACHLPIVALFTTIAHLISNQLTSARIIALSIFPCVAILASVAIVDTLPIESIATLPPISLEVSPVMGSATSSLFRGSGGTRRTKRQWLQLLLLPLAVYCYGAMSLSVSETSGKVSSLAKVLRSHSYKEMLSPRLGMGSTTYFKATRNAYGFKGPLAISGQDVSFETFLEQRFPLKNPRSPHLWITLGGSVDYQRSLAAQNLFVRDLNLERVKERRTELVVLCMTSDCVKYCEKMEIYAYGGYEFNRPAEILEYTWPKLRGKIDLLTTGRDCFFVDADVYWKSDPYPFMPIDDYDFILSENYVFAHGNTGWTFVRSTPATIAVYQTVLDLDLISESRDQVRTNEILGSTESRTIFNSTDLKMDFVTANEQFPATAGIRVHILDPQIFRHFHYEFDMPHLEQHESVFLHMTCGNDDAYQRSYIAASGGFGSDVDDYYSTPPKIIKIADAYGTKLEVLHKMAVLFAAAHYTGRAAMPPLLGIFSDLYTPPLESDPERLDLQRYIYSLFPITDLAAALNVSLVEPGYVEHATNRMLRNTNPKLSSQLSIVKNLQSSAELDLRSVNSFGELVAMLRSPSFASAQVVNIRNFDWKQDFIDWTLPETLWAMKPCWDIRTLPLCGQVCKWDPNEPEAVGVGKVAWDSLEDVLLMRSG